MKNRKRGLLVPQELAAQNYQTPKLANLITQDMYNH